MSRLHKCSYRSVFFHVFTWSTIILSLASIIQCAQKTKPEAAKLKIEDKPNLTMEDAFARSSRVSEVSYNLEFQLPEREPTYTGKTTIKFKLNDLSDQLRVDFQRGTVKEVLINGALAKINYGGLYLNLPKDTLNLGDNTVVITFEQKYSRDGSGLMWSEDPEDKKVYTYTDLEPYDASRVFPCFDQPDLKATYTMKVRVPKEWTVITSVRESAVNKQSEFNEWIFPQSAKFSTYIWSMHSGPYKMWQDKSTRIPLRLFARQTLAPHVNAKEWFTWTKQGFEFYNIYFGYAYPFKKYDQIIVPEFNPGAMENVGAVTFSERFIKRGTRTQDERRRLASTLLHEMAHMWFGDLVTMKWWNDLWLNESFATYMSTLAMSENTEFGDAWRDFHGVKEWAYWTDQLVTTHPIEASVPDTLNAMTNFDGITYGKGASVLQQLAFYLGADKFRHGMRTYFKTYAYQNTTLKDFMSALEKGSGRELSTWQKQWLQTSGLNTVGAIFTCEDNKVTQLRLEQKTNESTHVLRSHSVEVVFLREAHGKNSGQPMAPYWKTKVEISGEVAQVETAIGQPCPSVVYPNFNDNDYLKVELDQQSLQFLRTKIHLVQDPMLRQLFWADLWRMVLDGKFKYTEFATMLLQPTTLQEKDEKILLDWMERVGDLQAYYFYDEGVNSPTYQAFARAFDEASWKQLTLAPQGSELQKLWFGIVVESTLTEENQKKLAGLLSGDIKLTGFTVDQERRWSILKKLASHGFQGVDKMIVAEAQRDSSKSGREQKLMAEALRPVFANKKVIAEQFKKQQPEYPLALLRRASNNMFPFYQADLRERFKDTFFTDLTYINAKKDNFEVGAFANLAPYNCRADVEESISKYLASQDLQPTAVKQLRITRQENERCRKVISFKREKQAAVAL